MLDRLFLAHPRSVDESYFEHQKVAFSFAGTLFLAAAACALHGLFPALCEKTGSNTVKRLYERMVTTRRRTSPLAHTQQQTQPFADYAI
jgi:hypothetical protein